MKTAKNIVIIAVVIAAAAAIVILKQQTPSAAARGTPSAAAAEAAGVAAAVTPPAGIPMPAPAVDALKKLPRLVDLGADKCIPCKLMAPILDELKTSQAGRLKVDFIDVWKNPAAGEEYGVRVIPTQIFYAADGRELFRHEGFMAREDILNKWKEFGVDLAGTSPGL